MVKNYQSFCFRAHNTTVAPLLRISLKKKINSCTKLPILTSAVLIIISASFVKSSNHFQLDTSFPHESVASLTYYGSGIVLDMENNLIVLHRSNAMDGPRDETIKEDVVLVIDRISGIVLRQWGRDKFYHPHGIEVTTNGDIFITDSRLHQVFKVS